MDPNHQHILPLEWIDRLPEWGLFFLGLAYLFFKYGLPKLKKESAPAPGPNGHKNTGGQTREDALDHQALKLQQEQMKEELGAIKTNTGHLLDKAERTNTLLEVVAGLKNKEDVK